MRLLCYLAVAVWLSYVLTPGTVFAQKALKLRGFEVGVMVTGSYEKQTVHFIHYSARNLNGKLAICGIFVSPASGWPIAGKYLGQVGFRALGKPVFMNANHFKQVKDDREAKKAKAGCRVARAFKWDDQYRDGGLKMIGKQFIMVQ